MPDATAPSPSSDSTAPLTILLGCDTFAPDVNGAARFAERLAAGMIDRGHQVHVVAPAAGRKHGTWTEVHEGRRMTMHRLFSLRWPPHDWLRFAMPWTIRRNAARILDEVQPDVVHSQSYVIIGRGLTAEARKRGIRVIATNHLMPDNMVEFTRLPLFLQRWFVRGSWAAAKHTLGEAESVTTPTRRAAEFLEKNTGLQGVHAISCGVDVAQYTPGGSRGPVDRILFVGRVTGEKHIDVLVRAIALLPASLPVALEIVGDGDQRRNLEQLVDELGLQDKVSFTGLVTDEELKAAYTRATVLAMPSTAELQSIVTMEAMASGLPVVAADAMALPHLVHDGENGYLFAPNSPNDLAAKLERILTLPQDEFQAMRDASLRSIQAHDIERTLTTFESLYRGVPVQDPVTETPPRGGSSAG